MMTIIVFGLFALDRLLKYIVRFHGDYVVNKGVALGLFDDQEFFVLFLFPLVMILILILWINYKYFYLPLVLICAGAISNLIDRLLYNGVIDYIEISVLPVFNIADIMIVVGVILLFIFEIHKYVKDSEGRCR